VNEMDKKNQKTSGTLGSKAPLAARRAEQYLLKGARTGT
jgi:hypothetical protein